MTRKRALDPHNKADQDTFASMLFAGFACWAWIALCLLSTPVFITAPSFFAADIVKKISAFFSIISQQLPWAPIGALATALTGALITIVAFYLFKAARAAARAHPNATNATLVAALFVTGVAIAAATGTISTTTAFLMLLALPSHLIAIGISFLLEWNKRKKPGDSTPATSQHTSSERLTLLDKASSTTPPPAPAIQPLKT